MSNEVLVTGAAGFIGRHIVRACRAAGWRVTTLDNRVAAADVLEQTEFRHADLSDPEILQAIRDGRFVAVLHQAGISSTVEDDWSLLECTNVTGPMELASACALAGTRFVYASSHSVYGRIARRMASIISQLLRQAAGGEELRLFANTLEACRDYIPVETVAETCVRLIDPPVTSGVYNLDSGHATSFATLVEWCAEFSDAPITLRPVPNSLSERYQFWTCADMGKLHAALPDRPAITAEDVRLAAKALFVEFQAGGS